MPCDVHTAFSRRKMLAIGAAGVGAAGVATLAVNSPAIADQVSRGGSGNGAFPASGDAVS